MLPAWMGLLLAAMVSPPTPQPALKTIVTVHSSQFCTDLVLSVRPALVGLMRNDQLIGLGQSALSNADRDYKFGGHAESSFNQQGAATWSPNSGITEMLDSRERQLASAMAYNVEGVEAALANPNAPAPSGDDQAKLAGIKGQLKAILDEQRKASNILSGNADTADLASLYNSSSRTGIESDYPNAAVNPADLNGVAPLGASLTSQDNVVPSAGKGKISTTEPVDQSKASISRAQTSAPFYSPYDKLVLALKMDRALIVRTEADATKAIVQAAVECQ
jgi:hypothetical protein